MRITKFQIGRKLQACGRFFLSLPRRFNSWFFSSRLDLTIRPGERLGVRGEKAAALYLQSLGYRIIELGHRQRLGEIDIIAIDGDQVVFVEVKTWSKGKRGEPSQAVTRVKQERITRAALIYLKQRRMLNQTVRFDVVAIVWPPTMSQPLSLKHYKHAFEATGDRW